MLKIKNPIRLKIPNFKRLTPSYKQPFHSSRSQRPWSMFTLNRLTYQSRQSFVNIPIKSKFYHEQLPNKVPQILQLVESESVLSQKLLLLQHLTDLVINNASIILSLGQKTRIVKQLSKWKGRSGRFDKVATIAWIINKLNLHKQLAQLYQEIATRFENDEWYANFDQSLKALEAFTHLENQAQKAYIYPRIERNLTITVWEENMKTYKRIVVGLLESGRVQSSLWDHLQDFILRNLGMEYSLKTITDIFVSFALAKKGSDKFFQMLQKTIYVGHWHNYEMKHKILPGYEQTGQFYALLVQTYSTVKKNCDIYLMPNFLQYIYLGVSDRKTNYQHLSSFTRIIQHLPGLFDQEDEEEIITNLLQNKRPTSIVYPQIVQFYDTLKAKDIPLPKKLHIYIQNVLIDDIRKKLIPPSQIILLCEQLLEKGHVYDKRSLLEAVQTSLTKGFQYLQGEEAMAVLTLSQTSKFIPQSTKKQLALPGRVGSS